jgi:hypothetical protein
MMQTLTLDISPEAARRVAEDPERLAHVARMVEATYGGEPEPVRLSVEDEALITDRLERIESSELKETPFDSAAMRKRAHDLLKQEFSWEPEQEQAFDQDLARNTALLSEAKLRQIWDTSDEDAEFDDVADCERK